MLRCFIDPSKWKDDTVDLPPEEAHRLLHVLRARSGDAVTVFDGLGREATAELLVTGRNQASLRMARGRSVAGPAIHVTLIQALPKGQMMDLIVRKATELGASAIVPVLTDRTVVRLDQRQRQERADRWRRIAESAAKQCGTSKLPVIRPVQDLAQALTQTSDFQLFMVATVETQTEPLRSVIDKGKNARVSRIGVLIGPEGDFTAPEVGMAISAGAAAVGLGELVLRSETAALYALSVLNYEFGVTGR